MTETMLMPDTGNFDDVMKNGGIDPAFIEATSGDVLREVSPQVGAAGLSETMELPFGSSLMSPVENGPTMGRTTCTIIDGKGKPISGVYDDDE